MRGQHYLKLIQKLKDVSWTGQGFVATCPAHHGAVMGSLSVYQSGGAGSALQLLCEDGCTEQDIVGALGLSRIDLYDEVELYSGEQPPLWSSDIEKTFLFNIATDHELIAKSMRVAKPEDMYLESHQLLYAAIIEVSSGGNERIDSLLLKEYLVERNILDRVGGVDYLMSLGDMQTVSDIMPYALAIKEKSNRRKISMELLKYGAAIQNDANGLQQVMSQVISLSDMLAAPKENHRAMPRLLEDLYNDPLIMTPPVEILPRIAWKGFSTLFAAQEKAGKSSLLSYAVSQLSRGGVMWNIKCAVAKTLYISLEEADSFVVQRLHGFKADGKNVHIISEIEGNTPQMREAALRGHIQRVRPSLVVIDTLAAYGEGVVTDWATAAQVQPVVQSLTRLAHEENVGLILVHHAKKSDGKYRDSSAIGGGVDVILEMMYAEGGDSTLRQVNARGRMPVKGFRYRFDGQAFYLA